MSQEMNQFAELVKIVRSDSDFFCPVSNLETNFNTYLDDFVNMVNQIFREDDIDKEIPPRSYIRQRLFPIWIAMRPRVGKLSHLSPGAMFRFVGNDGFEPAIHVVIDNKRYRNINQEAENTTSFDIKSVDQMVRIVYDDETGS